MTLAESRMEKKMQIRGWLGERVDLLDFWLSIYFLEKVRIGGDDNVRTLSFNGSMEHGHYVLYKVVDAVQRAETNCHLEISYYYE